MTIRFTQLKLEVMDSPHVEKPREEYFAFTDSDMSSEYVVMGIGHKGIPAQSHSGSIDFVRDHPEVYIYVAYIAGKPFKHENVFSL